MKYGNEEIHYRIIHGYEGAYLLLTDGTVMKCTHDYLPMCVAIDRRCESLIGYTIISRWAGQVYGHDILDPEQRLFRAEEREIRYRFDKTEDLDKIKTLELIITSLLNTQTENQSS